MKGHHAWILALLLTGCDFGSQSPPGAGPDGGGGGGDDSGTATSTAYPLVLAHGMFGFDHVGPLDYFYGVAPVLTGQGREVFTPRVDPVQSTEVRGPQLEQCLQYLRAAGD